MGCAAIPDSKLDSIRSLYYEELLSVPVIARQIGFSQDSLYYFFRKHGMKRRKRDEERAIRFARKPLSFSKRSLDTPELKELAAIGAMLYWGEGYKGSLDRPANKVDFANSDPTMISLFLEFLRIVYQVDEGRLRVQLYCYSDQNIEELIEFWSSLSRVPKMQFIKPFVRTDFKEDSRKMLRGLVHIRYADKKLLLDIKNMIEYYSRKHASIV